MGDLAVDTAVERTGENTFTATPSPDWDIWGPNGGYLASLALRAAGEVSGRARPATLSAHFVGAGSSASPVDIEVAVNRATRVATSLTVQLRQEGRPWMVATVWGVDADLAGLEPLADAPPAVPGHDGLATTAELTADLEPSPFPFWSNFEVRPTSWIADWESRDPSEPQKSWWHRFVPTSTFDDPWIDACRSVILIDVDAWPAAVLAHVGELDHYAPTIELAVRFTDTTHDDDWLLNHARVPVASDGLLAATGQVWTADGRLAATGGSTLLCRPAARRPA